MQRDRQTEEDGAGEAGNEREETLTPEAVFLVMCDPSMNEL